MCRSYYIHIKTPSFFLCAIVIDIPEEVDDGISEKETSVDPAVSIFFITSVSKGFHSYT